MADIDNLTIQISAEANEAIQALNNLSNALHAVNSELDRIDPSRLNSVSQAAEAVNRSTAGLAQSGQAISELANNINRAGQQVGNVAQVNDTMQGVKQTVSEATREVASLGRALRNVGKEAQGGGDFRQLLGSVKQLGKVFSDSVSGISLFGKIAKTTFKVFTAPVRLATHAVKGLGRASDATTETAKKLSKELTRVSKMLKLMVTRMALRAVIKEVGNGFKSLALHSAEFNASVSSLMNGAKQLGYSFAGMVSPLINALAPAIKYVIDLLIKLANIINQVFSALTGAGTWNKAKTFTDDWASSIKGANKQAKELKKTVLGFDELNQLQEKYTSGGDTSGNITDMFETLPVEDKWKSVASYIKKIANRLFDPIKKAWGKVGDFVTKSWKYAMDEVLKLGSSIARDFWKVWEQEKTQKIFENILKIIGWIGQAVGNLASRFREAWDKNDTGLHILENIRDIVLIITEAFERMAEKTAEWAAELDFSPLLEGFEEWLESCKEPAEQLMGILEDIYVDFLLPIGKWAIEEGGPKLLKVFTDFNDEVKWDVIRARLDRVWKALEPFAKTVGEGLIIFIDRIADKVANFLNSDGWNDFIDSLVKWTKSVDAEDVANGLELICKAIAGYAIGKAVLDGMLAIMTFIDTIRSVAPLLKLAIVVSVALAGIEKGKSWGAELFPDDKELYEHYKGITGTLEMLKDFVVALFDWISNYISSGWDMIAKIIEYKVTFAKELVLGIFNGKVDSDKVTKAYEDMQNAKKKFATWAPWFDENEIDSLERFTSKLDEAKGKISDTSKETKFMSEHTASTVGKLREAADALENTSNKGSSFSTTVSKLAENARHAERTTEAFSFTQKNVADETEKAAKVTPVLTDKQKELEGAFKNTTSKAQEFAESHKKVSDGYKILTEDSSKVKTGLDNVKVATSNVVQYTPTFTKAQQDIINSLKGVETENTNLQKNTQVSWDNIKLDVANAGGALNGTYHEISKGMDDTTKDLTKQTDIISKAFSEDKWTFSGVWEGLKKTFEKAKDSIKSAWNSIADKLNGDHEIGGGKFKINLPKFAGGGFPEDGLFMANHGEMVGRFSNGKTAVANNEQIVQGISAGVYNAVTSAMANSNGGNGGYIANTIVVDGEVIARTITKAQQKQQMRFSPQMG